MTTRVRRSLIVVFAAALVTLAPSLDARAQDDEPEAETDDQIEHEIGDDAIVGLGLGHGTYTTGLTGKLYIDQRSALQLFFGDFGAYGRYDLDCTVACGFGVSADYVFEFQDLVVDPQAGRLFLGGGVGGFLGTYTAPGDDDLVDFGINGVFELGWHFYRFPLELIIDVRPALAFGDFAPDFLAIDGGFAARWYF